MVALNKFNKTQQDMWEGTHHFNSDAFKIVLTNTAPVATNTVYANISGTELASGTGYTTGGMAVTITPSLVGAVEHEAIGTLTVTATGSCGPFRYAVLMNDTAAGKPLIAWWDNGSSITMNSGDNTVFTFGDLTLT